MKNFNQFILTLLAAGLFASCSLTEEPTSFVNRKSFYKNESQCIAALNSCYMPANAIYTANFMLVTEACTDIWYSSSTTVDACLDVTPAKPQYGKNVWTQGYKGVMYCNECVECISSADLADGVKMPLAAEKRNYTLVFVLLMLSKLAAGGWAGDLCSALVWPALLGIEYSRGKPIQRQLQLVCAAEVLRTVFWLLTRYAGMAGLAFWTNLLFVLLACARGWAALTLYKLQEEEL